jgi:2-oxoisovalerate dehydrogenase E1 component
MKFLEEFRLAYTIRKVEYFFLQMFKLGKISGTVHTCVGQEFSGVFAAKYSTNSDFVVSNHRGHGHYLSFTKDLQGLIGELLGNPNGCSKGIGGSQHLYGANFLSNGIQGGMLPIAAGLSFSKRLSGSNSISVAFLGDGTLGEGILYETLNICSLWNIPVVFILEKNNISQSTSFDQNFSGNLKSRINGFGIEFFETSIYDIEELDIVFHNAFEYSRNESKPVFIQVELGRLNSHSKGDDNRDINVINQLVDNDPLNIFIKNNRGIIEQWDTEIDALINNSLELLNQSNKKVEVVKNKADNLECGYSLIHSASESNLRFNELIYLELEKILSIHKDSILIGEDIENNNAFNPNEYGGAFKVTRDLSNKFPARVKNTPISEQAIVGIAIGSALAGKVSVVEIMFGDFITLVLDQLLQHVSKFTLMYGVHIEIPFILRTPMGGFRGYGPTHSQSLEKHFLGIPGLSVVALNQLINPSVIFDIIIKRRQPVLLIENKTLYTKRLYENIVPGYSLFICTPEGRMPCANLKPSEGIANVTLVCYGGIVDEVLKSLDLLFREEEVLVDVFVVSELTNSYIPGLVNSISSTGSLCFVEEGSSYASFSSEVISDLHINDCSDFSLLRISNDSIIPSSRELEELVLPNCVRIKDSIINFLS